MEDLLDEVVSGVCDFVGECVSEIAAGIIEHVCSSNNDEEKEKI